MIRFLIGLFLAVTAAKFISGLRRAHKLGRTFDSPPDDVVMDARPCPLCGVYGESPCKNCRK
jgi:hypothetical protein